MFTLIKVLQIWDVTKKRIEKDTGRKGRMKALKEGQKLAQEKPSSEIPENEEPVEVHASVNHRDQQKESERNNMYNNSHHKKYKAKKVEYEYEKDILYTSMLKFIKQKQKLEYYEKYPLRRQNYSF